MKDRLLQPVQIRNEKKGSDKSVITPKGKPAQDILLRERKIEEHREQRSENQGQIREVTYINAS